MDMTRLKKYIGVFFSINMLLLTMLSCSSVPILHVNYRAPGKTSQLEGKKVFLEIRDSRSDKEMFGDGAKEDFQNSSGSVSLSVAEGEEKGFKIGVFPVTDMTREIFKERLKSLGLDVVTDRNSRGQEPTVAVDLQIFKLDLIKGTIKRTWTAKMAYNVEILENGKVLAGNRISGESEKLKIVSRKEADSLMSDLVTDLANRLDAEALFRQAGII
jgi:hypothetical protein